MPLRRTLSVILTPSLSLSFFLPLSASACMWDGERVGVILRGGKREMKEMGERVTIN
jgi:hypothetical protein